MTDRCERVISLAATSISMGTGDTSISVTRKFSLLEAAVFIQFRQVGKNFIGFSS